GRRHPDRRTGRRHRCRGETARRRDRPAGRRHRPPQQLAGRGPITAASEQGNPMSVVQRLQEFGISLPTPGRPLGTYVHAKRVGNLLYLSGKGPLYPDGTMPRGKIGADLSIEDGYRHARQTGLVLIAAMRDALDGDVDRVAD